MPTYWYGYLETFCTQSSSLQNFFARCLFESFELFCNVMMNVKQNLFDIKKEDSIEDVLADDLSSVCLDHHDEENEKNLKFSNYIYNKFSTNSKKITENYQKMFENHDEMACMDIKHAFRSFSEDPFGSFEKKEETKKYKTFEWKNNLQRNENEAFMTKFQVSENNDKNGVLRTASHSFESALTRELKKHVEEMEKKNVDLILKLEKMENYFSSQTIKFVDKENKLDQELREKYEEVHTLRNKLEEMINFSKNEKQKVNGFENKLNELEKQNKYLQSNFQQERLALKNEILHLETQVQQDKLKSKEFFEKTQQLENQNLIINKLNNENKILQESYDYVVSNIKLKIEKHDRLVYGTNELGNRHQKLLCEKQNLKDFLMHQFDIFQDQYNKTLDENVNLKKLLKSNSEDEQMLRMKHNASLKTEQALLQSLDEASRSKSVLNEECTKLRVEISNLKNDCAQKDNSFGLLNIEKEQLVRQNTQLFSENESLKKVVNVYEMKSEKLEQEKKELSKKSTASNIVIESLKKELSKLTHDLKSLKKANEESEKKINNMHRLQFSQNNEILDLKAYVEVSKDYNQRTGFSHCFKHKKHLEAGSLKSDLELMSREELMNLIENIEQNNIRNECQIKHFLSILSCYRNAMHLSINEKRMVECLPRLVVTF